MKKLTTLVLSICILSTSFGQSTEKNGKKERSSDGHSPDKSFQIGLAITSGLNWYRSKQSFIANKKQDATFGFGLNMNYMFTKTVGISTGINFDWDWYHVQYSDSVFYRQNNNEVLRKKEDDGSHEGFLLTQRTYKPFSISIPTMLIFKTNLIGYFKYYGKFGMRTNFIVNQAAKDDGYEYDNSLSIRTNSDEVSRDKMKLRNDLLWIRTAVGVAGGFEYFFTASTAFYAELSFFYGVTNLHYGNAVGDDKNRNMSLMNSKFEYFTPKSNLNQLFLKVGIMF